MPRGSGRSRQLEEITWKVVDNLYDEPSLHADFADRYERQLVPLLKAGYIVLCDRYKFTAFARDTVRGCSPDWVRRIYNFAALPDLTFFFKAPLEVSLNRILQGRPQLKYHEAGMDLGLSSDRQVRDTGSWAGGMY